MQSASTQDLKAALKQCTHEDMVKLCLRLARFKKDNKELLTYLLFEADDVERYVSSVKETLNEAIREIQFNNWYLAKKKLHKQIRLMHKYIRYAGLKNVEAELRLHFYTILKKALGEKKNSHIEKLLASQKTKALAAIKTLHEEEQRDYKRLFEKL